MECPLHCAYFRQQRYFQYGSDWATVVYRSTGYVHSQERQDTFQQMIHIRQTALICILMDIPSHDTEILGC